jgi:hypothetical protein
MERIGALSVWIASALAEKVEAGLSGKKKASRLNNYEATRYT